MGRREYKRWEFNDKVKELLQRGNLTQEEKRWVKDNYSGSGGLVSKRFSIGQYFTPKNVVAMIHRILDIQPGSSVLDLSCGTGAMFEGLDDCYLHGVELDHTAAQIASICHPNGIVIHGDAVEHYRQFMEESYHGCTTGLVDYGLGNPPFGLRLAGEWQHKHMELSKSMIRNLEAEELLHSNVRSAMVESEAAFIEMTVRCVKPGGYIGMVLPDSVLSNAGFIKIREWLMRECVYMGTISLPANAFYFSGTSVKTSVILARKKWRGWALDIQERYGGELGDYPILMASLDCIGWDNRGRPVYWQDDQGYKVHHYYGGENLVRDETLTIPALFRDGWLLPESEAPGLYEGNGVGAGDLMNAWSMRDLGFMQLLQGTIPEKAHEESYGPGLGAMVRRIGLPSAAGPDDLDVLDRMIEQDRVVELNAARELALSKIYQPSETRSLEELWAEIQEHEVKAKEAMERVLEALGELGYTTEQFDEMGLNPSWRTA